MLEATPGSYGLAPAGARLPDATRLGGVTLQVADLERSLAYYERVLGLAVASRGPSEAVLTPHGDAEPLVTLRERRGARPHPSRGRLGLFHFAILLPDRPSLARFVRHLGAIGAQAGASDHAVSEALYLTDPDGLGIEIYADRPRTAWRRRDRELAMVTDPLDIADLLRDAGELSWSGMPRGTGMGHLHLHVRDLKSAAAFYGDALGFDRTVWSYPGALFFGAGGYHHHLGTNLWAGSGATPPADDEAQLLEWELELPDDAAVEAAASGLNAMNAEIRRDGAAFVVRDPSGTPLRVRMRAP